MGTSPGGGSLLVEDMVTTGGSSLAAIEAMRAEGALVEDCLAIVSYAFPETFEHFAAAGVSLHLLARVEDLVREALALGRLVDSDAAVVFDWLADPRGWRPRGGG